LSGSTEKSTHLHDIELRKIYISFQIRLNNVQFISGLLRLVQSNMVRRTFTFFYGYRTVMAVFGVLNAISGFSYFVAALLLRFGVENPS